MPLARKIFFNTVLQAAGKIVAVFVIGLLTIKLLTGYLDEQGFGQYNTVLAFLGIVAAAADLGLYIYVVREISRPETDREKLISNALGLRLVTALGSLLLGALISLVFPYEREVKEAIFAGVLAFLFVSATQVLVGIFQKHLAQYLVALGEIVGRLLNLILVYLFVQQELSLVYFILAIVIGNAAQFFLTIRLARRYEKFRIAFDLPVWRQILRSSWPLAFSVIFNLVYFKADTIILSLFYPAQTVGVYSLPYKILEIMVAFPAMFVGLVMPILSRLAFSDWERFKVVYQRAFDAIFLMVIPAVITTLFFASNIIDLVKGGGEFADSPKILQILIFAVAIIFFGNLFGYAVSAVRKEKVMVYGYLSGAIFGLVAYFLLIPRFGYFGAASGTIATEALVSLIAYILVRKTAGGGVSLQILPPSLPAILALLLFFQFAKIFWIGEIAWGLAIYAIFLILFRVIPREFIKAVVKM